MASLMGLRMAASRPAASAMVRNAALTVSRWGRPKEMFETPSTVRTPSSCLQRRSASSVTRALSDPVEMVIVSASSTRFRRGMPRSSAARSAAICRSISRGPRPQFMPMAMTPRPSSRAATTCTSAPLSKRPASSSVTVARTGRPASLAARTAALSS